MQKSHKRAAGIMAVMLLVIVLLAAIFIAVEADHDCAGDDCPVCACIQMCVNTFHQIGAGGVAQAAVILPAAFLIVSAVAAVCIFQQATPVSEKVRLNN